MANQNDSFIDEVTDDLRRDRLFLLMRRYGWIAVAAIVILVGFAGWREWSAARETASAQAFGDAVLAAEAVEGDAAARAVALQDVAAGQPGQAALRDLLAGNALAEAGDVPGAVQQYEAAAAAAGDDGALRDLARLKSVLVQDDRMDPAARDAVLAELSVPGAPFELLALELKAVALVGADRNEDAVTLLRQIQQKNGLSQTMQRRLAEMLITLGVGPDPDESAQTAPDPTRAAEVVPAPGMN